MTPRAWIFGAAGAAALVLLAKQGGFDVTSGLTSGPAPSPEVEALARAIARAEGFYVAGSVPQLAHNPGDLKLGNAGGLGTTPGGITIYGSDAEGWAALYRQLNLIAAGRSAYYGLGMTIADMGRTWTATKNEQSAWAANVANVLGVNVNTSLRAVLT